MMKVIQTKYAGHLFRSRLEARWAVFFDTLGIVWDYELDGFELSNGIRYLPDFFLPDLDCYFEVKGPKPSAEEYAKSVMLSADSKKLVAMAVGTMRVEELALGDRSFGEWPKKGFGIELFGGASESTWRPPAFDFSFWDWTMTIDLPPFIQAQFPASELPERDSEEKRRQLIALDRRYYMDKHGVEHPRYRYGRYEKSVSWVKSSATGFGFAVEPDIDSPRISKAFEAARLERFGVGQK
ncbi:hypothetical protein [Hydrocarboniphaga effusa]|uniref:hypothetical protein n=1 Tax=Hydrocarboniphaga effusa TaxID=243629 RepID=UPI00313799FC